MQPLFQLSHIAAVLRGWFPTWQAQIRAIDPALLVVVAGLVVMSVWTAARIYRHEP